MSIGDTSVIKYLKKDIHNIGVSLFDLVKEDYGIRSSSDLLRKLSAVVVTYVSGRGSHDSGHGELIHKFAHIETNESFGG